MIDMLEIDGKNRLERRIQEIRPLFNHEMTESFENLGYSLFATGIPYRN